MTSELHKLIVDYAELIDFLVWHDIKPVYFTEYFYVETERWGEYVWCIK